MQKTGAKILISIAGSFAGAVLELLYIWIVCSCGEGLFGLYVFGFVPRIISSLILSFTVWKNSRLKLAVGAVLFIVSGVICAFLVGGFVLFVNAGF